jgi:hypothetical protein
MTPYADDRNQLSRVTLGALADLGYTVNYGRADRYVLNGLLASTAGSGGTGSGSSGTAGILDGGWGIVVTIRGSSSKPTTPTVGESVDQPATKSPVTVIVTPTKQQQPVTPSRPATGTRQFVVVRQGQAPVTVTAKPTLRPSQSQGFATYGK